MTDRIIQLKDPAGNNLYPLSANNGSVSSDFIITVTKEQTGYASDKTNAEIYAAEQADKRIILHMDYEDQWYIASEVTSTLAKFGFIEDDGQNGVNASVVTIENNVVTANLWSMVTDTELTGNYRTAAAQNVIDAGKQDALPTVTNGKYLHANSSTGDLEWDDALKNTATGSYSVTVEGTATTRNGATNVGVGSVADGYRASAYGNNASATAQEAIAIGFNAVASAQGAKQIGAGTNSTANTFQVGSYQMLDSTGKIPDARLNDTVAMDADVVHLTGAETVAGVKTFSSSPVVPTPTTTTDAANKTYVDTQDATKANNSIIASDYSSLSTYEVGDYVIYSNQLYRCTTAITTAEVWTAGHWENIVLVPQISNEITKLEVNLQKKTGTNLLNPANVKVGELHQKGGAIVSRSDFCCYVMDGVSEGDTFSVWKKNSSGGVDSQISMYITAWVDGTAVSEKGATNAHEYTVPEGVTRIDFSINLSAITGIIEIVKGTTKPSIYEDYAFLSWIAKDEFIPDAINRITTLESKRTNMKIFNVLDYGAVGDGSASNATADTNGIKAALLAGAGAIVYVPSGTYIINSAITIPSNTVFCGEGKSSKLVMADGTAYVQFTQITWRSSKGTQYSMVTTAEDSENIIIKNLAFDGGTKTTTDGIWGLTAYNTEHCTIDNVSVTNFNYVASRTAEVYGFGIFAFHADNVMIKNCYGAYCGYENIGAEYCNHVTVRDCYIGTAWRVPLQFHQGCHDVKVVNNTVESTDCSMTHSLLTLHGQSTTDFDDCVSDVLIDGNYFKGITIDSSSYPYRGGIQSVWQNEQNVRITNNTFDCSKYCITNATDRQEGTYVNGGWYIENNTLSGAYGISLIADNVIVKDNCIDTTGTAIAVASKTTGSARIISDNIFLDDSTVTNNVIR